MYTHCNMYTHYSMYGYLELCMSTVRILNSILKENCVTAIYTKAFNCDRLVIYILQYGKALKKFGFI